MIRATCGSGSAIHPIRLAPIEPALARAQGADNQLPLGIEAREFVRRQRHRRLSAASIR
jgi:hypothetical protein